MTLDISYQPITRIQSVPTWEALRADKAEAVESIEVIDDVGGIDKLLAGDVPTDSRWVPTREIWVIIRTTGEGVWASDLEVDEHALGQSVTEAKQALWRTLGDYFESLQRREGRLSTKLQKDFDYLREVLKER